MGRFLKQISLLLFVPLLLLAAVYFVTDPYKTLRPFSLTYFDSTNRDYLSSELFVLNYPEQTYDSFIFGSSMAAQPLINTPDFHPPEIPCTNPFPLRGNSRN